MNVDMWLGRPPSFPQVTECRRSLKPVPFPDVAGWLNRELPVCEDIRKRQVALLLRFTQGIRATDITHDSTEFVILVAESEQPSVTESSQEVCRMPAIPALGLLFVSDGIDPAHHDDDVALVLHLPLAEIVRSGKWSVRDVDQ